MENILHGFLVFLHVLWGKKLTEFLLTVFSMIFAQRICLERRDDVP